MARIRIARKVSPEYKSWTHMRGRVLCPTDPKYPSYGARGITIDPRWGDFKVFLADMGPRPSAKHSIERKDNDGPYAPWNCKWATAEEQARNRRSNWLITYDSRTLLLVEWSEVLNIDYAVLYRRLVYLKWTVEKAFTTPVRQHKPYAAPKTPRTGRPRTTAVPDRA